MTQPQPKKSDLPTRAASAVVMVAVAGTALWLGGWWWIVFACAVAAGVLYEWAQLSTHLTNNLFGRTALIVIGAVYVGSGCWVIAVLGGDTSTGDHWSRYYLISILVVVLGTDIGAYFVGRAIGGPRIAPKISPSKTWAGLVGGMLGASLLLLAWNAVTAKGALLTTQSFPVAGMFSTWREALSLSFGCGAVGAVIAQAGDFFESWMKRRAGVKDSGKMIPGHGGLFDRVDGLLAVCFVLGLSSLLLSLLPNSA